MGAQATVTETSLSRASDGVEKLKRQFVTGYAAAADFERNLKIVGSGLSKGKLTTEQAAVAIENLSRRYGQAIDPQSRLAQGNHDLATASRMAMESLTSQSSAVEDLTASYVRMAIEARAAQAAETNRSRFDQFMGVGISPVGAAASSASVFEAEFSRITQLEQIAKMRSAQSSSYFASDLNARLGIGGFGTDARASAAVFEEAERAAERYAQKAALLRAQLDPVRALQERVNAELAEYAVLAQRGEISATELARAQAMARGRLAEPAGGVGGRNFAATNAMFQFQDIGMMAAMGMNPGMIGLQQGSQLAGAFAGMSGKEALATTLGGLAGLVSPVSLIAIGLTAGAAAAIQFGQGLFSAGKDAETLDKVMKRHQETVKALGDQWGGLLEKQSQYGQRSSAVIGFGMEISTALMGASLRKQIPDVLSAITDAADESIKEIGGVRAFRRDPMYRLLAEDVDRLVKSAKDGSPDIVGLTRRISEMARASDNPGIRKLADGIILAIAPVEELSRRLLEAQKAATQLFDAVGPNGMLLSQGRIAQNDNNAAALFESQNRVAAERSRQAFQAQIAGITARSPQERAEAARMAEVARYDMSETAAARRQRIEQAGALALAQAQHQLRIAQEQRAINLRTMVENQQHEIDMLGKTGGELVALRKEYELTSQLRLEAAQQGIAVDERELALIKERAAEMGRLTDLYNRRRFDTDMARQISDANLSDRQRQIVTTLRQYGLPEDLNSLPAQQLGQQIDWKQAKELATSFGSVFSNELMRSSGDIGKAFAEGLKSSIARQTQQAFDNLFDRLGTAFANWVVGGQSGAAGVSGAGMPPIASAIMSSTTVASNDNIPTTDVASYIRNAALQRGIDPNIALRVAKSEGGLNSWNLQSNYVKNGVREPSYGPYQLYMGGGLGNEFQRRTGLDPRLAANGPAGVDFALDHAAKNGWGAWYGARNVGIGDFEGIGKAAKAIDGLGDAATKTAEMTAGLGQTLASIPQALMANGGGGGLLSGLTKYGMGLFSGSSQFATAWLKGGVGLYADGTEGAPGGLAMVGERGRELVRLPRGSQVIPNHRTESMMAAGRNAGGGNQSSRPVPVNISITGASGDEHVRRLVEQGVAAGLDAYSKEMERSGFGTQQRRFVMRRG